MKKFCIHTIKIILLFSLFFSCRKNDGPSKPVPEIKGEKRPEGTVTGTAVSKIIGAAGGTIAMPDSSIVIAIPGGALASSTEISIQPITNTNLAGIGAAFRLLPHGNIFQKPVSITWSYAAISDSINLPETLGLAFQDSVGIWQFAGGSEIDVTKKTATYQSTHFSDWSLMPWLILKPVQATLEEGEEITLEALHYIPFQQCNCADDIFVPLPEGKAYPVGNPVPLEQKYIGQWQLNGPGTLIPTTANQAVYKAH